MAEQETPRFSYQSCQRCGQVTWGYGDHASPMDCIENLREIQAKKEEELTATRKWYAKFDPSNVQDPCTLAREHWIMSDEGTALLERLGWTPPANWWTYGPTSWVPWGSGLDEKALGMLVARVKEAEQATAADVYALLIEIERLQAEVSQPQKSMAVAMRERNRLQRIADEAWECFCTNDPERRSLGATRIAKALHALYDRHGGLGDILA